MQRPPSLENILRKIRRQSLQDETSLSAATISNLLKGENRGFREESIREIYRFLVALEGEIGRFKREFERRET